MTSQNPIIGTKVGRARRSFSQLWQVPTFLLGLLAFIGAVASAPWRHTPDEREFEHLSQTIRRGLANPETDADTLLGSAEQILALGARLAPRTAESLFLMGSVCYRQAQQKPAAFARELWPRAEEHLEKALALELAEQDRPAAQYRLGYSLLQQAKMQKRAVELMAQTMDKGAEQPLAGYQLLVQANLKLTPPNVDGALAASRRILDMTPETNTDALAQARIAHGELLMRKQAWGDAARVFESIGPKTSRPIRIQARLLQARCCAEDREWGKAVPLWQELLKEAAHVEGGLARIHYALGLCYRQMDPPNGRETIKHWATATNYGGPAGQAAGLRLGEFRLTLGGEDAIEKALTEWKDAMATVRKPADFKNTYVPPEQALAMFKQALRNADLEPARAQEVAELMRKLAPGGAADATVAEAAEAAAKTLQQQLADKVEGVTAEMVAAQFRRAGGAHEQAARARPESEKPDSLWRAAQCQLAARETRRAQELLQQFVAAEKNEARIAEGWFTLADLCRGEKDKDNARKAYVKCLDYPKTPFAYKARIYLAVEEIDKKNYVQARDILIQNLNERDTSIDRASREKSAFEMCRVLFKMREFGDAAPLLTAFIRDFPENPNVIVVQVQLGECYRELAKKELANEQMFLERSKNAPSPQVRQQLDEERRQHRKLKMNYLGDAVDTYDAVIKEIEFRQQDRPLDRNEELLLRRANFGIGECHFDLEDFPRGLQVFQSLQIKHRKTVEGFWASLRICNLAEVLRDQPKLSDPFRPLAKESLRMLMEDLKAMPADHEVFRTPGVAPQESWQTWANRMEKTLNTPPKVETRPGVFP